MRKTKESVILNYIKTVMNSIARLCMRGVLVNKPDAGKIRPGKYYLSEKQETPTPTTPSGTLRNMVFGMIVRCPGSTCRQISEKLGANTTTVWGILKEMSNDGLVKAVSEGKMGGAIRYYYNHNVKASAEQQSNKTKTTEEMKNEVNQPKVDVEKSNAERKSDFLRNLTSRELMIELRDRGYTGTLYIKREIDIEAL